MANDNSTGRPPQGPAPAMGAQQWSESWHAVGHHVARLLAAKEPVTPTHLELTLAGHGALIRLLREVHRDLTARPQRERERLPAAPSIELLERDPVRALGDALERHTVSGGIAVSNVMATRAAPGTSAAWQSLVKAATLAGHAWRSADPESRPQQHQAWSVMADVAALSQAAALLDLDISRAASRMSSALHERLAVSPAELSDRYATAAVEGLRAAGERVLSIAQQGPLPDVGPLRQPVMRPAPLRHPAHVPDAQAAIAELLNRSSVISPRDFVLAVHAQARLMQHVVRLADDPSVADAAKSHLDTLSRVVPRALATVEPRSDTRALLQSQAVLSFVSAMQPSHKDAGRVAAALARSQPALIDALERTALRQLGSGSWLVPNPNERATSVLWVVRTPSATADVPDVVMRLRDTRPTAHGVATTAGHNPFPAGEARAALALARLGQPPRAIVPSRLPSKSLDRPASPRSVAGRPVVVLEP
ncbi:hypothetical protein [Aquipuribacter nitratireducens]|uniref:Uncharacterized protein n=1 Tax=Aquipuribacter nitratireducens TaxID=650104 RepID=A0ABW0GR79_9MICO